MANVKVADFGSDCSTVGEQNLRCVDIPTNIVQKVSRINTYFVGSLFKRYINREVTKCIF